MFEQPVFVSYDYENDKHYKRLLEAWHSNPRFRFVFQDESSGYINSENVGRVKASLTQKIRGATHTLVIVGAYANEPHPQRALIGNTNWINWEISQSKAAKIGWWPKSWIGLMSRRRSCLVRRPRGRCRSLRHR